MADDGQPRGIHGDPATVFFSYSRADETRARPLIDLIEAAGYSVWWDGLLGSGERFARTTEAALDNARAVVVLWSKASVDSHWVHDEATRGRDRRCLVPLSLDGSAPPLGFGQFQTIDVSRARLRADDPQLGQTLAAIAALHDRASAPVARATPPRGIDRRMVLGGGTLAIAGGAGLAWLIGGPGTIANSVAVLPFRNLSGDGGQDYFSEGLSAEIRNALARNSALKVAAEASSAAAGEGKDDAMNIARRLRVAFLLGGDVRIANDGLRIAVSLTDGKTGFSRLTRTFERPMGDALAVQSEIADAVTLALTNEIASASSGEKLSGGTANASAFDNYLRGKDLYNKAPDEAGERAALARFDAAIAIDPEFAAAHAARARSLTVIGNQYGSVEECRLLYAAAAKSAGEAVRLAPDLADAQSTLGMVLSQGLLRMRDARGPFEKSRLLGGGEATVQGRYGIFAASTGEDAKALEAFARALELDPLNPLVKRSQGQMHYLGGRYPAAIKSVEAGLALDDAMGNAHAVIGDCLFMLGKPAEARAAYRKESNAMLVQTGLAIAEHRLGNMAAAKSARARIVTGLGTDQLTFYQQAQIAAQWGESEAAIVALQNALGSLDSGLTYALRDPLLEPVRKQPEFLRLLKQLGFA